MRGPVDEMEVAGAFSDSAVVPLSAGRGAKKFTAAWSSALVVQDYAAEAIIDCQIAAVCVIDEAQAAAKHDTGL